MKKFLQCRESLTHSELERPPKTKKGKGKEKPKGRAGMEKKTTYRAKPKIRQPEHLCKVKGGEKKKKLTRRENKKGKVC